MFKLVGIKEILRNLIQLVGSHLNEIPNKQVLQKAYRDFLKQVQPQVPKPKDIDPVFLWKKRDITPLLDIFKEESILDDFEEVFDADSPLLSDSPACRIQDALIKLQEFDSSFADLIDIVIHTIFSSPSKLAGGGSTSAAIGCIWVDLRSHWDEQDILEFLVHETTHNLVFLDELCYTHYSSYTEIAKRKNFAWSAILSKPRPLDKVFHSIIVSLEILLFRTDYFGHPEKCCLHPPTSILLEQTNRSIDSIMNDVNLKRLLTDRAKFLLKNSKEQLKKIEFSQICAI